MSLRALVSALLMLLSLARVSTSEDFGRRKENVETSLKKAAPDGTVTRIKVFAADIIEQGKHNLNTACGRCHGRNGRGGKGPDLTDGAFRHVQTDREILDVIANGIPGTGMPGLGGAYEDFYLPMLAYIRSEGARAQGKAAAPTGDAVRGKKLFEKHQCASCHWVDNGGGRLGTNLSKLAATAHYVRESMRRPNSQIDGTHQNVRLVGQDGRSLAGKRLSENSFDILVMDEHENLYSIDKRDLETIDYLQMSLMPDYRNTLTMTDIEDLTTYVFSLQKVADK